MNKNIIAKEILKLARELAATKDVPQSKGSFCLRLLDDEAVKKETAFGQLKIVTKGSIGELNKWAKSKGLNWKDDKYSMFDGYWVNAHGDAYIPDVLP